MGQSAVLFPQLCQIPCFSLLKSGDERGIPHLFPVFSRDRKPVIRAPSGANQFQAALFHEPLQLIPRRFFIRTRIVRSKRAVHV